MRKCGTLELKCVAPSPKRMIQYQGYEQNRITESDRFYHIRY